MYLSIVASMQTKNLEPNSNQTLKLFATIKKNARLSETDMNLKINREELEKKNLEVKD